MEMDDHENQKLNDFFVRFARMDRESQKIVYFSLFGCLPQGLGIASPNVAEANPRITSINARQNNVGGHQNGGEFQNGHERRDQNTQVPRASAPNINKHHDNKNRGGGSASAEAASLSQVRNEHQQEYEQTMNSRFLKQLHIMIMAAEESGKECGISWTPDGSGFVFHDKEIFLAEMLNIYFPTNTRMESLLRSMNRWKIKKIRSGPESGIWRHKQGWFFRGSHSDENIRNSQVSLPKAKSHQQNNATSNQAPREAVARMPSPVQEQPEDAADFERRPKGKEEFFQFAQHSMIDQLYSNKLKFDEESPALDEFDSNINSDDERKPAHKKSTDQTFKERNANSNSQNGQLASETFSNTSASLTNASTATGNTGNTQNENTSSEDMGPRDSLTDNDLKFLRSLQRGMCIWDQEQQMFTEQVNAPVAFPSNVPSPEDLQRNALEKIQRAIQQYQETTAATTLVAAHSTGSEAMKKRDSCESQQAVQLMKKKRDESSESSDSNLEHFSHGSKESKVGRSDKTTLDSYLETNDNERKQPAIKTFPDNKSKAIDVSHNMRPQAPNVNPLSWTSGTAFASLSNASATTRDVGSTKNENSSSDRTCPSYFRTDENLKYLLSLQRGGFLEHPHQRMPTKIEANFHSALPPNAHSPQVAQRDFSEILQRELRTFLRHQEANATNTNATSVGTEPTKKRDRCESEENIKIKRKEREESSESDESDY